MRGLRRLPERPIPEHPYRGAVIVYGLMALALIAFATLTGGDPLRATLVAVVFFAVSTAWSWWRFHVRIQARDAAKAAATARGGTKANGNGNGPGGTR
jgi:hypothetical protein